MHIYIYMAYKTVGFFTLFQTSFLLVILPFLTLFPIHPPAPRACDNTHVI